MRLPTGSSVERGMQCAASCVLPRAGHTGEAAVYGSEQHKEIEDGDMSRPVVRKLLEGATDVRHEVSYALDIVRRTVRELGVGLGRAYGPLDKNEIALTIDVEFWKDGALWVGDWKSRSRVALVGSNWQIRCAAMAVMARHSEDSVIGFLAYLDDNEHDTTTFDAFDVTAWWDELRAMKARIDNAAAAHSRGETLNVSAGSWCTYCPALPYCPAHTRLALSLLGELESVDKAMGELTVEQCGRAWELAKRVDVLLDRVKESIRERARREPVPLSNGRRLALVDCKRRSLDTKLAADMLGAMAPFKTTSYTQIKEVKLSTDGDDNG